MIPVCNQPVIERQVSQLMQLSFGRIIIVAGPFSEQIRHQFRDAAQVSVIEAADSRGTADALSRAARLVYQDCLVLYGDVVLDLSDLKRLSDKLSDSENSVLVTKLDNESASDHICCRIGQSQDPDNCQVTEIAGHPRGSGYYRFAAFSLKQPFIPYLAVNSGIFEKLDVGVMPTHEQHLELSLIDWMKDGQVIRAIVTEKGSVDIDKPWHILMANYAMTVHMCERLTRTQISEQASIDETAKIDGHVTLGKGSRIGYHVIIQGNVIIGDHTVIENGAIIEGNVVIGDHCRIENYCHISSGTTIGSHCVVSHCAEISGMLMDGVYLYHYMEISGLVGTNTDIGAATVCGSLRFDDRETLHRVRGRLEQPPHFANATYIGDYCRTGVNATIMPGCKTGLHSIIGPGVVLKKDLPDKTLIQVEQQLTTKEWGPEKYGW